MPEISVIVPIYNTEKYLCRCIDSILAQTFTDYELILVDDGSPDRCGKICDEWAKKDNRICVIHKENGGAANARNAGLAVAHGKYIAFVDSDDTIHPQYLKFLVDLIELTDSDIAMCHYDFFAQDGEWLNENPDDRYELLNGQDLLDNFRDHYRKVSLISLCMKIFRREIFDNLRIPEGYVEEDSLVLPLILERARKIARSDNKLYHWRINPESVTRSPFSEKSFAYIEVSRFQAEFFIKRKSRQADYFKKDFLQRTLHYYYKIQDEKPELMESFKFHLKRYYKLYPRYIWANGLCIRERIAYTLFLISPQAARKQYNQVYGELEHDS